MTNFAAILPELPKTFSILEHLKDELERKSNENSELSELVFLYPFFYQR